MKAFRILTGLIILVALLGMGVHSAQAAASPFTYNSGFQVQNIDPDNPAIVTINFYNSDGTQPASSAISDTIPAGSSKTYFPLTGLPSGFQGSVVISSSTQVASVVNILGSGAGGNAAASYVAAMTGGNPVLLPLLMAGNSGYNTWFSVQNTGDAATDVNVTYSDGTTNSKTALQPGAAWVFDQSTEAHTAKVFSGSVASPTSVPLAVAVLEENTSIMFAYSGFLGGSANPVIPLINSNNSGYITGTQIMNAGASSTNVTVAYTPSLAGTACTETQTIPAGDSRTFTLYAFTSGNPQPPQGGMTTNCAGGAKFIGSAQVTINSASINLVAITNQLKPGVNGEANNDFDPSTATSKVVLPLIMDRNSGYFTGISVMNVGSVADINCTFTNTTYTVSQTAVAPFSALSDIQNGKIANGYVGSGTCTAGAGGKLVTVVNELSQALGDNLLVYEGININVTP